MPLGGITMRSRDANSLREADSLATQSQAFQSGELLFHRRARISISSTMTSKSVKVVAVAKCLRSVLFVLQLTSCVDHDSAREIAAETTSARLRLICQALVNIYVDQGRLPKNEVELKTTLTDSHDGYLRRDVLIDGWKRQFRYFSDSENSATVWSYGKDEKDAVDDVSCSLTINRETSRVREVLRNVFLHPESSSDRPISDYRQKWNSDERKGGEVEKNGESRPPTPTT